MTADIGGVSLAEWVLRRSATAPSVSVTALVTSTDPEDDVLETLCVKLGMPCFRGSLPDVRQRYIEAARHFGLVFICRVCGDSPFVDTCSMSAMVAALQKGETDYARVTDTLNGFVSEAFTLEALERSAAMENLPGDREHVTPAMIRRGDVFRQAFFSGPRIPANDVYPQLTVDAPEDLRLLRELYASGLTWQSSCAEVLRKLRERFVKNETTDNTR